MPKVGSCAEKSEWKNNFVKGYCNYLRDREVVHDIVTQIENSKKSLDYEEGEAKVLANFILGKCHVQQYMSPKAIKKYGNEAVSS